MSEPSAQKQRPWRAIACAVAAVLIVAHYVLWRAGVAQMEHALAAWVDERRAAGLDISHGAVKAAGYPLALRVHIDAPEIAAPGVWRWRGTGLSIDAPPYGFDRLIFLPAGIQSIRIGNEPEWRITADRLRAVIAADKARDWAFSMSVENADAVRTADGAHVAVDRMNADLAPAAGDLSTLVLNFAATGVDGAAGAASFRVDGVETTAALTQTHALSGPDAAALWRAAQGALIIKALNARAGETALSLAGEITLDEAGDPSGALHADITNPAGLADQLRAAGVLTAEDAEAAAAGLTLMAIAGGGKISAPVELSDGSVHIGGVKIAAF